MNRIRDVMSGIGVVQLDTPLVQQLRKVPSTFSFGKDGHGAGRGRERITLPLVIAEEKQLVSLDRSTNRPAKHVPAHLVLRTASRCTAPVALPTIRIEHVIA